MKLSLREVYTSDVNFAVLVFFLKPWVNCIITHTYLVFFFTCSDIDSITSLSERVVASQRDTGRHSEATARENARPVGCHGH